MTRAAPVVWAVRAAWMAMLVAEVPISAAIDGRSPAVHLTVTIGSWAAWGVVLVALLVPATVSLTLARAIIAGAPVAAATTVAFGADLAGAVLAFAIGALSAALVMSGELGESFAQATAYGDESRLPLRPPLAYLVAVLVTWIVVATSAVVAALALAARVWPLGIPTALIASALVTVTSPRFHALSRRWLVFVPAGVVVHDHLVLAETVMFRRPRIVGMHLALADTSAVDLTGPASGHAVEIALSTPERIVLARTPAAPRARPLQATAVLVAPTRPGRALAEARRRGIGAGVGASAPGTKS